MDKDIVQVIVSLFVMVMMNQFLILLSECDINKIWNTCFVRYYLLTGLMKITTVMKWKRQGSLKWLILRIYLIIIH